MRDATGTDPAVETEPTVPDYPPVGAATSSPPGGGRTRRRRPVAVVAIALLIALLGFGGGVAGFLVADEYLADDQAAAEEEQVADDGFRTAPDDDGADQAPVAPDASMTPREIYRKVSPSVVHIEAQVTRTSTGFFGIPQEERSEGTGSGFVVDDEGHVVTNAHVVQGAEELTVSFGTEVLDVPAKLVGADPSSDIAVIKVDPDDDRLQRLRLRPLAFGDSGKLQVGDPVLAIGNPFGLDRTLTTGVVSALQRHIPALNEGFEITDVIQTDAAVNPGNSGGPLLDAHGRVIGVNSQIQTGGGRGFDGVAFAVPSNTVRKVARELIAEGKVSYAWLGVAGRDLTPELAKELDVPVKEGVLVGTVTPGSPADDAGLTGSREVRDLGTGETSVEGGDVLLSFDGERLTSMRQLAELVDAREPGDKVRVEYVHDGRRRTTTVTLGERPESIERD